MTGVVKSLRTFKKLSAKYLSFISVPPKTPMRAFTCTDSLMFNRWVSL